MRWFRIACLVALLELAATPVAQAAEQYWQLTFTYSPKGLFLLRAAPMPPLTKAARTPGLNGAALRLDYDLEWLDPQGRVLRAAPVTIPLGGHCSLFDGGPADGGDLSVRAEGAFVVRVRGPEEVAAATQVRLRQAPGMLRPAAVGGLAVPPAFELAEQTFALPLAFAPAAAPGPIGATKVRNNGPDANRLVIVIMGDGFTAANLATGTFSNKTTSFLNALLGTSPWNSYSALVNVYRVDIVSNESGADYEDAAPEAGGTLKDTYLNAGFWVGGTERCCYLRGDGATLAFAAADDLVGVGVWDEILVFANSTKYGGCGGSIGVSSINSASDEVQIHEFGHSFGSLADEYDYGSTSTNCTPSPTRNIDCPNNFPLVKWQVWVTNGTPIPTPNTSAYDNVVGAFEGAAYQTVGIFRPMRNCKMRNLGVAFCPVCKEAHVLKFFEDVRIVDGADPPLGAADVPAVGTRTFRVTPVSVSGLAYQWFTNGVVVTGATGPTLVVNGAQVTVTNFQLRLLTGHTTALVRAQAILQTNDWTLTARPLPVLRISDVSVVEGDSGTTTALVPVWLSYPPAATVTVGYATVDGTATAGSDYLATNGLLSFPAGSTTNFIRVRILGDVLTEPDEVLFVNLFNVTNAVLGDPQGAVLILDRDQPPSVVLTAPAEGSVYSAPASVGLAASASDPDGSVVRVEFFAGSSPAGTATNSPFGLVWSNVPAGQYALRAVATDDSGRRATSAPVNITVLAGVAPRLTLLDLTNTWHYDATTNDYGTAWQSASYDDILWSGPAPGLFYNEDATLPGPKSTLVPLVFNTARVLGYYFRTRFLFPSNPPPGLMLVASNLVDDGAVFWLNGAEAARLRMPAGAIVRTNLASGQPPGGDATNFEVLYLPTTNLLAGSNVLAVEVHQQSASSSDVVFGMKLEAWLPFAPVITDPAQPADRAVAQGQSTTLSVTAVGTPAPAYQWFRNGAALAGATAASYTIASMTSGQAGHYFVRVTNLAGATTSRVAVVSYATDTTPPSLVYALGSTNPTRLTVSFSEPINAADGATLGNYSLRSEAGASLAMGGAVVTNGSNVVLTTAVRAAGVNYWLTVNDVRDLAGNRIAAGSTIAVASEVVVVAGDGFAWRYFQSDRDPGPGWMVPGFDDVTGWGVGPGLLDAKRPARSTVGPNNEPVRTQLNLTNPPGAARQTLTYYFRSTFDLPGPAVGARLRLRPLVDDGAAFYLNGAELLRLRLPPAPATLAYTNLATTSQGDSQNVYEGPYEVPASALRDRGNLLAVEVHQATATSSDLSFALQVIGELPRLGFPPLALAIAPAPGGFALTWERADAVLETAPEVTGPWAAVNPPAASPYLVVPGEGRRFFRLRAP